MYFMQNSRSLKEASDSCHIHFNYLTYCFFFYLDKINVWDTAGMERTRSLTSNYYRGSQAVILVYAIDDMYSLTVLRNWIVDITKDAQEALKFLVGNKTDLADEGSQVDDQLVESFCKNNGIKKLYRVSAKTGAGVKEMFDDVVKMLISNMESTVIRRDSAFAIYAEGSKTSNNKTGCPC